MLFKNPGFTLIAMLTLALGIGANTAIFSVINSVLLRPLPYPNADRLVTMRFNQSVPDLADIESESKSFEAIGGVTIMALDYTGGTEPQQIKAALVTSGLSRVLGVQPLVGRLFSAQEDRFGGERQVVLTHGFWQNQLASDPNVIGKTIPLRGNDYTIIGVLRRDFELPREDVDVWSLVRVVLPEAASERGVHFQRTYCLLKPERTLEQARTEMQVVDRRLEKIDPVQNKDRKTVLIPLQERIVGGVRPALLILFGAVMLVLLIACSNYANLLLARATTRRQEMQIRMALGAGRGRLLRQMLTESVMMAVPAGLFGLILAVWGIDILQALKPENLPRMDEIRIDYRVLLFTLSVSTFTGLLFGLIPALAATGKNVSESIKESGRTVTSGSTHFRLRSVLVTAELAVALLLLIGAGLLIKAFHNLQSVDPGFNEEGILTMRIELPEARYEQVPEQTRFRDGLLDSLNSYPEMKAAMISELPLTSDWLDHNFIIEGRPVVEPGTEPSLFTRSISGDYFRIMGMPLIMGRDFTRQDGIESPLVGIVNQAMVRTYFQDQNPLGARVRWAAQDTPAWITVVGVVGDVKHFGLDQPEEPALYTPYAQTFYWKRWMNLIVRSTIPGKETTDIVKNAIRKLDPQLPVTKIQWMSEWVAASVERQRFNMLMLGIFASVALLLSAFGIFGVISYLVTHRTHEIGIRMALGANTGEIVKLIVGQGLILTIIGIVVGLGGAIAVTRLMSSLLFGVSARDPITFAAFAALLAVVALLASYLPARRAGKTNPMIALRYE